MDVTGNQLDALVKRLEAESGMGAKVRMLAGSWPLVLKLTPHERERVALAVGSRWAMRHLEGLFGRPEELSTSQLQIKAIFESMHDADPDQLRRLGKEIRSEGVAGAQSRLLGALEEVLEENIAGEHEPPPADAVLADSFGPAASGGAAIPGAPPPPWLPPKLMEDLNQTDETSTSATGDRHALALESERLAETTSEHSRRLPVPLPDEPASGPRTSPVEVGPARTGLEKPSEPVGARGRSAAPAATETESEEPLGVEAADAGGTGNEVTSMKSGGPQEPEPEPELPQVVDESAELEDAAGVYRSRGAGTLSAIESLRELRRLANAENAVSDAEAAGTTAAADRASRAALVASLGSGWAGRRAVSSLIRSRQAADLEEALDLIRRLPTAQQAWCLGDVVEHWKLDGADRERVLAAAPSEAARRRLARRVGRRE